MKRFKYRLETVLTYKTQILDNLKTEHAAILQNVNRKQEEIRGLNRELLGFENDFDQAKTAEPQSSIIVCLICASGVWRRSLTRKRNV